MFLVKSYKEEVLCSTYHRPVIHTSILDIESISIDDE